MLRLGTSFRGVAHSLATLPFSKFLPFGRLKFHCKTKSHFPFASPLLLGFSDKVKLLLGVFRKGTPLFKRNLRFSLKRFPFTTLPLFPFDLTLLDSVFTRMHFPGFLFLFFFVLKKCEKIVS